MSLKIRMLFIGVIILGFNALISIPSAAAKEEPRVLDAPKIGPIKAKVKKTHDALFSTFSPLDALPSDNRKQAIAVRDYIWSELQKAKKEQKEPPPLLQALRGFTFPALLLGELPPEVRRYLLKQYSKEKVIRKFLKRGYAKLDDTERHRLLKTFLESPLNEVRRVAAGLRTVYSSSVYGSALGFEIAGVERDKEFVDNMKDCVDKYGPKLPPSPLVYSAESQTIVRKDGTDIDYLVVGSGPGGAVMAHELRAAGHRVVLVDRGPFVVPGTTNTQGLARLMIGESGLTTTDGGIFIRSGQALGGGSTVNVDLAFSPLEATAQARIQRWADQFLIDPRHYTIDRFSTAYRWVQESIGTRAVREQEINENNKKLWRGAQKFGVAPSLYRLNRFSEKDPDTECRLINKRSAVRMLLIEAMEAVDNPLSVIPDAAVERLIFEHPGNEVKVQGVMLEFRKPWREHGNTVVDPSRLGIEPGTLVTLQARNVILSAGSIGTTEILLRSRKHGHGHESVLDNPLIGMGPVLHPAMPIIGMFCDPSAPKCANSDRVDLLEGLRASVHVDTFGIEPGFILEAMSASPAYGSVMIPGRSEEVYDRIRNFRWMAGFGVLLIDTPSDHNAIVLDPNTHRARIEYSLSEPDLKRMREGVGVAIRMMFLAGAKQVIIPSNENFLEQRDFDPTVGAYLSHPEQAAQVERDLDFIPNRTTLTSAHMQASNKMGPTPEMGVVSWNHRVWNYDSGREIPNLYIMDSSIFPTSVGANPMQSIYTFAKILADRLNTGDIDDCGPCASTSR